jgi:hypothetical protein
MTAQHQLSVLLMFLYISFTEATVTGITTEAKKTFPRSTSTPVTCHCETPLYVWLVNFIFILINTVLLVIILIALRKIYNNRKCEEHCSNNNSSNECTDRENSSSNGNACRTTSNSGNRFNR